MLILNNKLLNTSIKFNFNTQQLYYCSSKVRVRFAPSPTGNLHLGGLRTALYNYLLSKKLDGKLILRVEDTDQKRLVPGSIEGLVKDLKWSGIEFDEGPNNVGEYGPYVQSQRLHIYSEYIEELINKGKAYKCFCTPEKLEKVRELCKSLGKVPVYDGTCRNLSKEQVEEKVKENLPYTVRLKFPNINQIQIQDEVYGNLSFGKSHFDDIVLIKGDKFPTYHFANVVDDHLMKISHVIRGEEWINSLPKHVMLYNSFDWQPPKFLHLPLLHNPTGGKLSKRMGDSSVGNYKNRGFLKEALINFVAMLGWSPKDANLEVMNMKELINQFEVKGLNKGNPKVFEEKLIWLNREHLVNYIEDPVKLEQLASELKAGLEEQFGSRIDSTYSDVVNSLDYCKDILQVMKGRIDFHRDILHSAPYFFVEPDHNTEEAKSMLKKFKENELNQISSEFLKQFESLENIDKQEISLAMDKVSENLKVKKSKIMSSLRFCLTATKMGPPIPDLVSILPRGFVIERIRKFI
ncbi:Glutamyl-tRNA synthetase [Conidiobolus coronatus NRRL 28638]|uniref:Glutamate--tRNA ligase, mitochondrial n=1 Tax=Conidiobolus coronatus (strain ATCC 28846 / CBS 209.66 / NRRL 28638) TaxID=796925 RepID=A0A137P336_CONC2|nr:Glutamyl-tRNA synthetase [Conidiobolus coronatus NRRL 28638]|eukprot:KXN69324.1 Glutamyl-tRNA synthetase [Conidiobolus coronatus NRRL 28638]